MLGPIIHGERVRLEPPRPEHLPAFVDWFADPAVTRYLLRRNPPSLAQEEAWLERTAASKTTIVWAIVLDDSGALIGVMGLHRIDWRHRHAWIELSIGAKSEWGKGYATETLQLGTHHALRELGLEKVLASVYSGNEASWRVLEKVGYRQCGLLRRHAFLSGMWHDEWLAEMLREEWKATADGEADPGEGGES